MQLNFEYSKKYKSCEIDWFPSDTRERFNYNLTNNYEKLNQFGWIDKKITYKFNSHGFRSNEFLDNTDIMFLGCSNTVGIGLPLESTWSYIVSNTLKKSYANLAIGGSSPDTAFRMCLGYIDKINPKVIIYNEPPKNRIELVTKTGSQNIMLSNTLMQKDQFLINYTLENTNLELNFLKNSLAIEMLCVQRNIKFIKFNNYLTNLNNSTTIDLARDLSHPGVEHNLIFSKLVLSQI
jgi:hypothetical protein